MDAILKELEHVSAGLNTSIKGVEQVVSKLPTADPTILNDLNAIKRGLKSGDFSEITKLSQRYASQFNK